MADQPKIITVSISGSAGEHRRSWRSSLLRRVGARTRDKAPPELPDPDEEKIERLNAASGEICAEIERQVKKLVGPEVSVQAEISFSLGSIVIEGTVVLLYWSGTLLLDTIKKEVGELVRVPIKRILAEVLTDFGGDISRLEIDTSVRSRSVDRAPTMEAPTMEKTAPVLQLPAWMNAALAVIALGIAFLVADRLVSEWPARPVPGAPPHTSLVEPRP
jgi:hypothetical protein